MTSFGKSINTSRSPANRLAFIGGSRAGTEFIQQGTALGALLIADTVLKQPLEPVNDFVSKRIIRPNLRLVDRGLDNFPSLQTPKDKAEYAEMSRDDKADAYAKNFVKYAVAFGAGLVAQVKGQELMDKLLHIPNPQGHVKYAYLKIAVVDRTAQLGAIVMLNTLGTKPSISMQNSLQNILQKAGFSEEKAEDASSYLVNWTLPNMVGAASAVGAHYQISSKMPWR